MMIVCMISLIYDLLILHCYDLADGLSHIFGAYQIIPQR